MVSHIDENIEYTPTESEMMAITINEINNQDTVKRSSFIETLGLKQEIKKFGQK